MDTPPDTPRFRLVFTGECHPGHDPQTVRAAVVAALKLDEKRAARLFSGRRVVVRRNVDLSSAHRYIVRLSALGAVVHAEPPLSSLLPPSAAASPATAGTDRSWRRPRRAAVAAVAAVAGMVLLVVAAAVLLGPGTDPAAPSSEPAPPLATPSPPEPAPAPSPVTNAVETSAAGETDLPDDMTPAARQDFLGPYRQAPGHKAFAISTSRHHGWHAHAASADEARVEALNRCMTTVRPGEEGCRVIDEDGQLQE